MSRTTLVFFIGWLTAVQACHGIEGNGRRARESRDVSDFNAIQSGVPLDVQVRQGDQTALVLSLDSNLVSHVYTDVRDNVLTIESDGDLVNFVSGPHILITLPHLFSARTTGSGNFDAKTFDETETISLDVSGSGPLVFAGSAPRIEAVIDGSGDMHLSGTADDEHLAVSGSGSLDARDVDASEAYLRIAGSGGESATVDGHVVLDINGSGNVDLYGAAVVDRSYMFGPGELRIH